MQAMGWAWSYNEEKYASKIGEEKLSSLHSDGKYKKYRHLSIRFPSDSFLILILFRISGAEVNKNEFGYKSMYSVCDW